MSGRDIFVEKSALATKVCNTFVVKALFATKISGPDIHTAVAFLTTPVQGPNKDDWKKLLRLMQYLRNTTDMPLTLRADGTNIFKWWVDGSYTVHPDMSSQTGGTMSLGKGEIIRTSIKQKMNTKGSIETELIAADDLMPHILWTNYFLNWKGYNPETQLSIKTTRVQFFSRKTVRSPAVKGQSTLPSDITSSLPDSRLTSWTLSIVPRDTWWQTIS